AVARARGVVPWPVAFRPAPWPSTNRWWIQPASLIASRSAAPLPRPLCLRQWHCWFPKSASWTGLYRSYWDWQSAMPWVRQAVAVGVAVVALLSFCRRPASSWRPTRILTSSISALVASPSSSSLRSHARGARLNLVAGLGSGSSVQFSSAGEDRPHNRYLFLPLPTPVRLRIVPRCRYRLLVSTMGWHGPNLHAARAAGVKN